MKRIKKYLPRYNNYQINTLKGYEAPPMSIHIKSLNCDYNIDPKDLNPIEIACVYN